MHFSSNDSGNLLCIEHVDYSQELECNMYISFPDRQPVRREEGLVNSKKKLSTKEFGTNNSDWFIGQLSRYTGGLGMRLISIQQYQWLECTSNLVSLPCRLSPVLRRAWEWAISVITIIISFHCCKQNKLITSTKQKFLTELPHNPLVSYIRGSTRT